MSTSAESAHEFGALNTLLLVVVLGLCIVSAYLIKQNSLYYLPESAAAIIVGLVVGGLARAVYPSTEELDFLSFNPEIFFFFLLPPIIFEAGYSLKKRDFFANFWTISLFAVFGTIISAIIIGYLVYFVGLLGWVDVDTSSPLEALLFGAMISAVDPVATLSIMGNAELNCDPLLYSIVFGESVLNDAVAIVLFRTFMGFYESGEAFTNSTIPTVMFNFTATSLGSVLVGVVVALMGCYLFKQTQMYKYPEYEISLLFLFAYGAYSFAEAVKLSGIMSLFFCGIVLSHYNSHNLSPTAQVTTHTIFKSLAQLSEMFVFLYIGMGLFTERFKSINVPFFLLAMFFCVLARFFNIFPLSYLANFGRQYTIPVKMQTVLWFTGLRGAISFALSQTMPGEHTDLYIATTLGIVIFTTVVCGGLTEPMLSSMGMRSALPSSNQQGLIDSTHNDAEELLERGHKNSINNNNNNASSTSNASHDKKKAAATRPGVSKLQAIKTPTTPSSSSTAPGRKVDSSPPDKDDSSSSESMSQPAGSFSPTSTASFLQSVLRGSSRNDGNRLVTGSFMQRLDANVMNPIFGGPSTAHVSASI